jgi:deoxyribodipyrimidine photo-lyase
MSDVPGIRIADVNEAPIEPTARYVLYWMTANRRAQWNFALDRSIEWCRRLQKPLVVLEPLRCDYRWASHRFHRFVMDGMQANAENFAGTEVRYYPYVEPQPCVGRGLLAAMAQSACIESELLPQSKMAKNIRRMDVFMLLRLTCFLNKWTSYLRSSTGY